MAQSAAMPRFRTGLRTQTGPLSGGKGLAHMVNYLRLAEGGPVHMAGGGDPVQQLQSQSRGTDTQLAHISPDEVQLLDYLHGGTQRNPQTGLPEYGWLGNLLKGLVRAGATIAGGMVAGPMGAAAGAGLSTKLTGGSWNDALKSAAFSGIGGELTQGLGGGGWDPTKAFGQAGAAAGSNAMRGASPGFTDAGQALPGIGSGSGAISPSQLPPNSFGGSIPGGALSTPVSAASGWGQNLLAAARSGPGIASMMGALSVPLDGSSAAPATVASGPNFSVRPMQRKPVPYTGDLNKYGFGPSHQWYEDTNPAPQYVDRVPGGIDYSGTPGFADGGNVGLAGPMTGALAQAAQMGYMAAAKGGAAHQGRVSGPGGGQDDLIDAKLSNGEHVITAREVSALGDGDNATGQERMYALRQQILKKAGYKNTDPTKQTKPLTGIGAFQFGGAA